ncbi:MAG: fumarylacetoacetate hydrolase family protein [Pseudomonadota bacterium]
MFTIPVPTLPTTKGEAFPVRRILCIGKNYADHVAEMGGDPKATDPVFFTKPADAACAETSIPFPLATEDLHYEGELVVALQAGGVKLSPSDVPGLIYGYACGCDLTRRDLQAVARERRAPWDLAKALDNGAMIGPIEEREGQIMDAGPVRLSVNGELRQDGDLSQMVWSIPEMIAKLSLYFELKAGDLIFTGTPSGVGALHRGDQVEVTVADLPPLRFGLTE